MDQGNLAGSLRQWALEEMKYHDSFYNDNRMKSLPTEEDFNVLCKKPLVDVWTFMLKHVRSIQTVKRVKGNLAFRQTMQSRRGKRDKDEEGILEKSNHLVTEISQCSQDNGYLEKEIDEASKSLMEKSLAYEKVALQVRNIQRKKSILRTACNVNEGRVAEYAEYAERIDACTRSTMNKHKESIKDNHISGGRQHSQADMETESCHDILIASEKIEQFLHKTIDGEVEHQSMEATKADLWKTVKQINADYRISTICDSLAVNATNSAKLTRDEAVRVNIALDAQNLSFSLKENGQLLDVSEPPSVQKNVQQLLQVGNDSHMLRWMETLKHENESWKVEAQLDDLKAQIHKLIHKALGEHPFNVPLAKQYVDQLLHLASERAVAPCLRREMNSVLERISLAKAEKEELQSKFSQIQDFKNVAEQKQNCIALLARHNTSAPESLEEKRKQVKSYLDSRGVVKHDTRVKHLAASLSGSLKGEVDKFSSLSLPCLLSVSLDSNTRVNILDLSISPSISLGSWDLLQIYPQMCLDLHLPPYKSPDQVALHIRNLILASQDAQFSVRKAQAGIRAACDKAHTSDDATGIRDLCRRSREHDKAQSEALMPVIRKSMDMIESAKKNMPNFSSNVQIWWDQPAQFLTPWAKAEGMTFEQWKTKWRIAVTAIHKKMVAKKTPAAQNMHK